jgi:hypothetical protein
MERSIQIQLVAFLTENNVLSVHQSGFHKNHSSFATKQKLGRFGDFTIQLQGKLVERVPKFSYLGIMLDEQMSWKQHKEEICNKVSKRLGILSRIHSCLTIEASECVYNSLVQPIFDYTDAVWSELLGVLKASKNCKTVQHE